MEAPRAIPLLAHSLECPCDLTAVRALCVAAREFFATAGLTAVEQSAAELALAEAANNAVKYVRPAAARLPLRVDLLAAPAWFEIRVCDHTPGFDFPTTVALPADDSESGRGLFLIRSLMAEVNYLRGREENCLVLRQPRGTPAPRPPDAAAELRELRHTLDLMTEELASSYESLAAIFRFSAELQDGVSSAEFIHRWLSELLTVTESDWFVLRLADRAGRQLRLASSSRSDWRTPPLLVGANDSVEARAAVQRSDVWFDAAQPLAPADALVLLAGGGVGFAHPLFVNDVLVGVLTVGRQPAARAFAAAQVNVIQTFADFLGLQLRSSLVQQEQVSARLDQRDLEIAANIQRRLLPQELPDLPRLALAGFYRSARQIGGDYYDALPQPDGNLLLVIADVMGKGLPAALFSMMFRSLVRARQDLAPRPGEFLTWLNQNLFHELDQSEMFITAQLVFFDCQRGEIRLASAGHPPLLLASPAGIVTEISSDGLPLGIQADAGFPEQAHQCPGGRALMFTDGLIEARSRAGQLLGLESLKQALSEAARAGESSTATKLRIARLLNEVEQGIPPADDTAFLVIASRPAT